MECDNESDEDKNFNLSVVRDPIDEEGVVSYTSCCQLCNEELIEECFKSFFERAVADPLWEPKLYRHLHINYLNSCLLRLPQNYQILDCNRAWLCYWITHSLYLLNVEPSKSLKSNIVKFLSKCQSDTGGFGGGPMQASHLAPTYAAILCIATLGTPEAYQMVNRKTLHDFLMNMRIGDGSFRMHRGGEIDVRAVYCALVVAKLMNIYSDNLFAHSGDWICRCQTYEGGFAGFPGMEAHGGYSFCAIAALHLLEAQQKCDLESLLRWSVNRQMRFEGGFQGRTNKLVDGCYSFWQGATVVLSTLLASLPSDDTQADIEASCLFNSEALQEYILICCQSPDGGLKDKPKLPRDCYHTCYALGGLSLAQNLTVNHFNVIGDPKNLLPPIHPVFNVGIDKIGSIIKYFREEQCEKQL